MDGTDCIVGIDGIVGIDAIVGINSIDGIVRVEFIYGMMLSEEYIPTQCPTQGVSKRKTHF